MTSPTIHELGEQLGIALDDTDTIREAFTHASYANENPGRAPGNNERLEFLGDAVLGLIASQLLYERFPDADEGQLTAYRASLVNRSALAELALGLGLDRHLQLGRGEMEGGGAQRPSLLSAALEALAGAIFLDAGLDATDTAFRPLLAARLDDGAEGAVPKSAKSRLQEWSQRQRGQRPSYRVLGAVGPAHAQEFTVEVLIGGEEHGTGHGSSRQRAEEAAAEAALGRIEENAS